MRRKRRLGAGRKLEHDRSTVYGRGCSWVGRRRARSGCWPILISQRKGVTKGTARRVAAVGAQPPSRPYPSMHPASPVCARGGRRRRRTCDDDYAAAARETWGAWRTNSLPRPGLVSSGRLHGCPSQLTSLGLGEGSRSAVVCLCLPFCYFFCHDSLVINSVVVIIVQRL